MNNKEMSVKIRELKELQQLIEEATAEAEAIKDEIKAEMEARSVEEMVVDVFKIRWTKVSNSRFDTASFKKAMPELARKFTKESEIRRFTVV